MYGPYIVDGYRGALPGFVLGAVGCTMAQLLVNELEVTRLKFVSRKLKASSSSSTPTLAPIQVEPTEPQNVPPFLDRIASLFGLQRISNEEYLMKLKKERDVALTRIAVLENDERERMWTSVIEEAEGSSTEKEV